MGVLLIKEMYHNSPDYIIESVTHSIFIRMQKTANA